MHNERDDVRGRGTEGQADADLTSSLGGTMRDEAIHSGDPEQQAEGGEGGEEEGGGPLGGDGVRARFLKGLEAGEGDPGEVIAKGCREGCGDRLGLGGFNKSSKFNGC